MKKLEFDISLRLIELRKQSGYTQQQIADGVGIKMCTYQAYEEDRAVPNLATTFSLVEFYGFKSIEQLLGMKEANFDKRGKLYAAYMGATDHLRKIVDYVLKIKEK